LKLALRTEDPDEADDTFEVEKIVGHRDIAPGETVYTVKWKGIDESQNSELPEKNFNSKALISRYFKQLRKSRPELIPKNVPLSLDINKVNKKSKPSSKR
jgi:hypothetical protein